jgi:hypothetical protein
MHASGPSFPVKPALHAHTFEIEPSTAENFPSRHAVHEAGPGLVLKVPAPHEVQAPAPSDPVEPALQAHSFKTDPTTAENFPNSHPVHEADPGSVLYVPSPHGVHVAPPLGPVDPALQAHTFEVEPVTAENLPVPQSVHAAAPESIL